MDTLLLYGQTGEQEQYDRHVKNSGNNSTRYNFTYQSRQMILDILQLNTKHIYFRFPQPKRIVVWLLKSFIDKTR